MEAMLTPCKENFLEKYQSRLDSSHSNEDIALLRTTTAQNVISVSL
jgi:hypothetical protein